MIGNLLSLFPRFTMFTVLHECSLYSYLFIYLFNRNKSYETANQRIKNANVNTAELMQNAMTSIKSPY